MKWEYTTVHLSAHGFLGGKLDVPEFERLLNSLGSEGWELVNVFDTTRERGATRIVIAVFKRPS